MSDAPSEMEVSEKKEVKISFGLKKKIESKVVTEVKLEELGVADDSDEDDKAEELAAKRRKLTHFEDGMMPEDEEDLKKKEKLVIPIVQEVDWRVAKLLEQEKDGTISEEDRARLAILTEANPFLNQNKEEEDAENAIVVEEHKNTEDADYSKVAVESFGLAILRGCGWKEGEGIGKNPQVVALRIPEQRPKGLGLGAAPKNERKKAKNGEKEEVSEEIKTGSLVKITQGNLKGAYAKVDSRDDDNASLFVRIAIGGRSARVSLFGVVPVSKKEYERESKCINKDDYEREKKKIDSNREKMERKEREKEDKHREKKKYDDRNEKKEKHVDHKEVWARPNLIVRMVSEEYKKGRHLDEKMTIVDVADRKNITLQDHNGAQHYNIRQSWIETVIPRNIGDPIMIVRGEHKGEAAVMEDKDKGRQRVQARILRIQQIVPVSFDDVCSYRLTHDDLDE